MAGFRAWIIGQGGELRCAKVLTASAIGFLGVDVAIVGSMHTPDQTKLARRVKSGLHLDLADRRRICFAEQSVYLTVSASGQIGHFASSAPPLQCGDAALPNCVVK